MGAESNHTAWLIAAAGFAGAGVCVLLALRSLFSREARERRRRARSHGRVVSKAKRPIVILAANTGETKTKRRRWLRSGTRSP